VKSIYSIISMVFHLHHPPKYHIMNENTSKGELRLLIVRTIKI